MTTSFIDLATQPKILLAAVDEARNVRRGYEIERTVDLFDWQTVTWWWGRLGTHGSRKTRAFATEDQAVAFVRHLLMRRATAPRRVGVAYCPRSPH